MQEETRECPRCRDLEARIAQLERQLSEQQRQIERLTRLLEEERRKNRRQAAPFSKGEPKAEPRKPGRKAGRLYGRQAAREIPRRIDERVAVECPLLCPDCGDSVRLEGRGTQYQIDLPKVSATTTAFEVQFGRCQGCGRRVQGRDRRQVSDALGVGRIHFGANVVSRAAFLNKALGLSYGKMEQVFKDMFGLDVDRSTLTRALSRLARKAEPTYEEIKRRMRQSMEIYPDETGWRVGGRPAWLHAAATPEETAYLIGWGRGYEEARELIGEDFDGVIGSDGWAPYWRFPNATHQTCNAHLLRRCNEMLETATRGARRFPTAVKRLLKRGILLRHRRSEGEISQRGLAIARGSLESELDRLLASRSMTDPGNRRLAKHLRRSRNDIFFYLYYPHVEATNWPAEQAIRPAVVNRKNSGGNRTARGARMQAVLMSLLRTYHLRHIPPVKPLSQILHDPVPRSRLPSPRHT